MPTDKKQLILLILQIIAILFILISGPFFIQNIPFLLMQVFGLLLICWGVLAIKLNKNEAANLPKGYFVVTKGPYEIIRHPIYAGLLLTMAGFVQGYNSTPRFLVFVGLVVVTLLKITLEESFMEKLVKEYSQYELKTHRLIPYFY